MSSDLWACTHLIFDKTEGQKELFLGVAETIVGSLLLCCVGIVQSLFNLL